MKKIVKRILGSLLPLVLAFVFVAGTFEVGEMLGAPGVASYAINSGGDSTPTPSPSPAPAKKKGKKANTIKVTGKTVEIPITKVSKKTQTIKRKTALTVSKAKGKVTYKKKSGNKKITINKKTGKITVKKGLKLGTYKFKVKVTAAGTSKYKKKTVTKTVTIKVVKAANPMIVTAADINVVGAELEKDAMTIPVSNVVTVKDAQGAVTYEAVTADEGISVEGDYIIVSKGLAPGTYKLQIEVTASGNAKYEAGTKYAEINVIIN